MDTEQNPYAPPKHSSAGYAVIENSDLRASARRQLSGVWGKMVLAGLVYGVIASPAIYFFARLNPFDNPALNILFSIAYFSLLGPLYLGFSELYLKRVRAQDIAVNDVLSGLNRFGDGFLLTFFFILFTFLWSLLFVVPGIIKAFGYSMAYFIMYDDPTITPLQALKKSQMMMRGYKGKLCLLFLSFIGWASLPVLTGVIGFLFLSPSPFPYIDILGYVMSFFGWASFSVLIGVIGSLWLYPYIGVSMGNFYENLKQNQGHLLGREHNVPSSP